MGNMTIMHSVPSLTAGETQQKMCAVQQGALTQLMVTKHNVSMGFLSVFLWHYAACH